jgi:hypothetical protein
MVMARVIHSPEAGMQCHILYRDAANYGTASIASMQTHHVCSQSIQKPSSWQGTVDESVGGFENQGLASRQIVGIDDKNTVSSVSSCQTD